jgi:hypothetical protein
MKTSKSPAIVILGAALILLGLAACGGGDGGDGARDLAACDVMTAAEAEQWLGSPVEEPTQLELPGGPDEATCNYENLETGQKILVQVNDGRRYFAEEGSGARGGPTVDGLGEDAWADEGTVAFTQNDWSVHVSNIVGGVTNATLMEIARFISTQLP